MYWVFYCIKIDWFYHCSDNQIKCMVFCCCYVCLTAHLHDTHVNPYCWITCMYLHSAHTHSKNYLVTFLFIYDVMKSLLLSLSIQIISIHLQMAQWYSLSFLYDKSMHALLSAFELCVFQFSIYFVCVFFLVYLTLLELSLRFENVET